MSFLDKRSDTEKEISQLHKKPKFTIEIGREAKKQTLILTQIRNTNTNQNISGLLKDLLNSKLITKYSYTLCFTYNSNSSCHICCYDSSFKVFK